MKTVSGIKLMSFAIAGLFMMALGSQNIYAEPVQEQISITNDRTLGPEAERIISRSAAKVLRQIAEARTAINSNDLKRAKTDLLEIIMQINVIRTEMPSAKVHDHITVAREHLNYDTTEEVLEDLVPIEASLVEIADLVPVQNARQQISKARAHLEKGDRKAAKQALEAADQEVIYTQISLPLSSTEHYVIQAQVALNKNQPKLADKALKEAENGVEFLSEIVSVPAIRVHETMGTLIKDNAKQDYVALKQGLSNIEQWLNRLLKSTDSVTRNKAAQIKGQIDQLTDQLTQKSKDYTQELKTIWHHSKTLAERESDKASIGWKNKRPDTDIRADLIDAKQKIAFAENLEFEAMADPKDIFKSLDEAKEILNKVSISAQLDEKGKQELKQAIKEIDMIHNNTPAPNHKNLYQLVLARISGLIYHNY